VTRGKSTAREDKREELAALLGGRPIVLVGMMGAGKTTVGRRLANKLGRRFIDSDEEIENAAGMTIDDIFKTHGEADFRSGEVRVIARLLRDPDIVLGTGGGAFINPETRALVKSDAVSVWIKADFELLFSRVSRRSNRPLLKTANPRETLRQLIETRYPTYAEADVTIVSQDVPQDVVANEIIDALLAFLGSRNGRGENAMANKPHKVRVPLGERAYDILIGDDLIDQAGEKLKGQFPGRRFGIVTDTEVAREQLPRLRRSLEQAGLEFAEIVVPDGEATKSWSRLGEVVEGILSAKLERGDLILALGGGVIGDLAGFAAAIARRGMDFVQIPTSLLAQVDSSVGGKTGINSPHGKNLIGAFHQPKLVLADLSALDTLPPRQFASGYAEVVKYGLIDDEPFFFWLEEHRADIFAGGPARAEAIARACAAKARFVLADEKETGVRALLNLGHTFGHALEAATGYSDRLLHGEGVAIGMILAHGFSAKLGLAPSQDTGRIAGHLKAAGLPTRLADIPGELPGTEVLMNAIAQDKKVVRGTLTFILTRGIGKAFVEKNVDPAAVSAFLDEMRLA
jgi:shikimate kinase / 3-dehydroquinate synthase